MSLDDAKDLRCVLARIVIEQVVIIVADRDHGSEEDVRRGVCDWVELGGWFAAHVIIVSFAVSVFFVPRRLNWRRGFLNPRSLCNRRGFGG